MAVCLTIFTEHQEWYTFVPLEDAAVAAQTWKEAKWGDGVDTVLDVSGVDIDLKAQRAIFAIDSIIGMSISDVSRWKKPAPLPLNT